jgi:hypothetical protein
MDEKKNEEAGQPLCFWHHVFKTIKNVCFSIYLVRFPGQIGIETSHNLIVLLSWWELT